MILKHSKGGEQRPRAARTGIPAGPRSVLLPSSDEIVKQMMELRIDGPAREPDFGPYGLSEVHNFKASLWKPKNVQLQNDGGRVPFVVILNGIGTLEHHKYPTYELARRFARVGFAVAIVSLQDRELDAKSANAENPFLKIEEKAGGLKEFLVMAENKHDWIDWNRFAIIAHSQGGVVALAALAEMRGVIRPNVVGALCSPFAAEPYNYACQKWFGIYEKVIDRPYAEKWTEVVWDPDVQKLRENLKSIADVPFVDICCRAGLDPLLVEPQKIEAAMKALGLNIQMRYFDAGEEMQNLKELSDVKKFSKVHALGNRGLRHAAYGELLEGVLPHLLTKA